MKLERLRVENYRSLHELDLRFDSLNVLIGTNASGKSNILDSLRFLAQGIQEKDFAHAVGARGNVVQLAWKGAQAESVSLQVDVSDGQARFEWSVKVQSVKVQSKTQKARYDFKIVESLHRTDAQNQHLLQAEKGSGWWWSEKAKTKVKLALPQDSGCALAAAAVDESFSGRTVADFVSRWGFFDPSPAFLRGPTFPREEGLRLDLVGRNLAGRLFAINESDSNRFERIVSATNDILGVPEKIVLRQQEDDGRIYFVQTEAGLNYPVHQLQASSGTLRMIALMTALLGEEDIALVGIEEPENYVHPNALGAFAKYLNLAKEKIQIVITTHSPLLLNFLNDPEAICVVSRHPTGTKVVRESEPAAVRKALDESGFGLGEFYETKGFGG
jgi:predicted ATPase